MPPAQTRTPETRVKQKNQSRQDCHYRKHRTPFGMATDRTNNKQTSEGKNATSTNQNTMKTITDVKQETNKRTRAGKTATSANIEPHPKSIKPSLRVYAKPTYTHNDACKP